MFCSGILYSFWLKVEVAIPAKPVSLLQARFVASEHVESFEHLFSCGDLLLLSALGGFFVEPSGSGLGNDEVSIHLLFEESVRLLKRLVRLYEDARQLTSPPFCLEMDQIIP